MDSFGVVNAVINETIVPETHKKVRIKKLIQQAPIYAKQHAIQMGNIVNNLHWQHQDVNNIAESFAFEPPLVRIDGANSRLPKLIARPRKQQPQTSNIRRSKTVTKSKSRLSAFSFTQNETPQRSTRRSKENENVQVHKLAGFNQFFNNPEEDQLRIDQKKKEKIKLLKNQAILEEEYQKQFLQKIIEENQNNKKGQMIFEKTKYLKQKVLNGDNLPQLSEYQPEFTQASLMSVEKNPDQDVITLIQNLKAKLQKEQEEKEKERKFQDYIKNLNHKQTEVTEEDDATSSKKSSTQLEEEQEVKVEEIKEPHLDYDNFNENKQIVSHLKDFKQEDFSGQQSPIRDVLKPYYGVQYHESADSKRNITPITLAGESIYLAPEYSYRKRIQDMNDGSIFNSTIQNRSVIEQSMFNQNSESVMSKASSRKTSIPVNIGSLLTPLAAPFASLQNDKLRSRSIINRRELNLKIAGGLKKNVLQNSYMKVLVDHYDQEDAGFCSRTPTSVIFPKESQRQSPLRYGSVLRANLTPIAQETRNRLNNSTQKVIQSHRLTKMTSIRTKRRWDKL